MYNEQEYLKYHIVGTNSPAVQIFSGKGRLHNIVVNSATPGVFEVIDSTSPVVVADIAILGANAPGGTYSYDIAIARGLQIRNVASPDITVTYTTG